MGCVQKGDTLTLETLLSVNRFAMKKVVSSYAKEVEKSL